MTYLLDTDHLSILQRRSGQEYVRLAAWMATHTPSEFACSIISFHWQLLGAHSLLNKAKDATELVRGYELMQRLPRDYIAFALLPFDTRSATVYERLRGQGLRIGTMDLRLASIALARNLVVLTRNLRDFGRVPGLKIEDRTS